MRTGLVYTRVDGVSRVMNRVLAEHDVTTNVEPATRLYNAGLDIVAEERPRLAERVVCSVTSTRIIRQLSRNETKHRLIRFIFLSLFFFFPFSSFLPLPFFFFLFF